MLADLHLHTTASDGSDSPAALMRLALSAGIGTIAITDHDTVKGLREAVKECPSGLRLITGAEFSARYTGAVAFDCHILAYGFDPEDPHIAEAIRRGREMRYKKLGLRLEYLKERYSIVFTDGEIAELRGYNSVAKPHLAWLIVKRGLAFTVGDAIATYMTAPDFPDDRIDAEFAIDMIKRAGGVSSYAHPLGGEKEPRLPYPEVVRRIELLSSAGLSAVECYYSRYSSEDEDFLAKVARDKGLLISGGSDYHGRNKTVELGRLASDGRVVTADMLTLLSEFY